MTVDRNSLLFDNVSGAASSGKTANLGEDAQPPPSQGSRIASAVLSPAVQLWLRSQVEQVDELKVKIEGSDRQILSGTIPKVTAALADDIGEKRLLYEELKVAEYWVVDVQKSEIIAFAIISDNGSRRIVRSEVLPGLTIALLEEALRRSRIQDQSQVGAWLLA